MQRSVFPCTGQTETHRVFTQQTEINQNALRVFTRQTVVIQDYRSRIPALCCYKHPSKYTHYKQVKGTAIIINEGKTKVIESKESILKLIDEISRQRIQENQDRREDAAQLEMLF